MKNVLILCIALFVSVSLFGQSDTKSLEVVNASITAAGGKEKMEAIKSMIRTMEINMPFGTAESESYHKNGKFYMKSMMNGSVGMEQKYDGNRAFVGGMQGNQVIDDEKAVQRVAQQGKIFPFLDMTTDKVTLKYIGTEKINGKECHKIVSKTEEGESTIYFDVASNLLARMITKGEFQGNTFESTMDFSDYKEIEGIKFAHKMAMSNAQFSMDMKVKSIKLNAEIADKMFMIE